MLNRGYETDLTDAAWELVKPLLPAARHGGRPRTTDVRAVVNAIFYLLRTGCQWRLLPHQFPPWGTVYHYLRSWEHSGIWVQLHRAVYEQARIAAGRAASPSVVIMDGQSVNTTERGGPRGFDGYKRVKGRKRHILVDTLGLMIAHRVEPANMSDRRAGARLLGGLGPLFPRIHTVIADLPATSSVKRVGNCRLSNVGSAPSRSAGLPGLWSGASPGWAAIVGSARITSTGCKRPRRYST
jgi:putative transposase